MRYWRPWRRLLHWLLPFLPERGKDRLLDYLYPDDALITFPPDPDARRHAGQEELPHG